MTRLIKSLIKLAITLVVIFFVLIIGFVTFVDPNRLKDPLEQQIYAQTGRKFVIQGPIRWRIVPWLVLETKDVSLKNAAGFENDFLKAQTARFRVEFIPLWVGKIVLDAQFKELTLALEKKASGANNWDDIKQKFAGKSNSNTHSQFLYLNGIKIEQGLVSWKDETARDPARRQYYLTDFNLTAEDLFTAFGTTSTPVSFHTEIQDAEHKTLGKLEFSADWQFDYKSKQVSLNHLKFLAATPDKKELYIVGQIRAHQNEKPFVIEGTIQVPNSDLDHWFELPRTYVFPTLAKSGNTQFDFKYKNNSLEIPHFNLALGNEGSLEGTFKINPTEFSLENPTLSGQFSGKKIPMLNLMIDEFKTTLSAEKGVLHLNPLDITMAGNALTGQLNVNLQGGVPRISLEQTGKGIHLNSLLVPFPNLRDKIQGQANLYTKLVFQGKTEADILKSLSGQAQVELLNGKIIGINLISLLQHAQTTAYDSIKALQKKQLLNIPSIVKKEIELWKQQNTTQETPFDTATFSLNISNGVLANPDLQVNHTQYSLSGQGVVDLPKQTVDYRLAALLKASALTAEDDLARFLKETPLLVQFKGNLSNPTIRPDLEQYLQNTLKFSTKNVVEKLVDKALKKVINNSQQNP